MLMARGENPSKRMADAPEFIPIDEARELFACGSLVGWKHRKDEAEYLRKLHCDWVKRGKQPPIGSKAYLTTDI